MEKARRPKKIGKKRRREEETYENETGSVKRRCVGSVSVEALKMFSRGRDLQSCGCLSRWDLLEKPEDLSDIEPETRVDVSVVLDVTDVLVPLLWLWWFCFLLGLGICGTAVRFFLQSVLTLGLLHWKR